MEIGLIYQVSSFRFVEGMGDVQGASPIPWINDGTLAFVCTEIDNAIDNPCIAINIQRADLGVW